MPADVVGGLSLAGLMVPEAIAYSGIAGLPTRFGIIAAVVGPLAYAVLGRSRLAVVSATSGSAALLGAAIIGSGILRVPAEECAIALSILVALFLLIGAAFRVSALTSFISRAVLHGFGLGLALTICIRQLPALLGIKANGSAFWQVLASTLQQLPAIHLASTVLGLITLALLALSRRFKFPAAGFAIVCASILLLALGPRDHFGIAVAGRADFSLVLPRVPALHARDWGRLAQLALPLAIVILAESWATIRALATLNGDVVDPRREIAALGLANLCCGVLRGLPVGAGFSIGNANAHAGTQTRQGAIFGALVVAALAYGAARWIALVPQPVLAAIVIAALSHALSLAPIRELFRLGRDQWIALLAAVGVLALGIVNGLLLAVGLSITALLRRLAYPSLSELGRSGAHDFVDRATHAEAVQIPGVLVIRPNAPLFFANAESTLGLVHERARAVDARSIVLSLEETDDLDSSSFEAICDFVKALAAEGRSLVLARVHDRVRTLLQRGGLRALASTATFSVDDAVRSAALAHAPEAGTQGRAEMQPIRKGE